MTRLFDAFATAMSNALSQPLAFILAMASIVAWAATGPLFHYSESWQIIVNTGTTIISFLMIFIVLADSRRENGAIQLKLDELIRAISTARNEVIAAETQTRADIEAGADALRKEVGQS